MHSLSLDAITIFKKDEIASRNKGLWEQDHILMSMKVQICFRVKHRVILGLIVPVVDFNSAKKQKDQY